MVGETKFPFGQYEGKSIACIALTDYPYLAYMHPKIRVEYLRHEVSRVRKALNSFASVYKCLGNCEKPAERFSFAQDSMRHTWDITDPWWFCADDKCAKSTGLDGPQLFLPVKYDTILKFALNGEYQQSRRDMLSFLDVLNGISGFKGSRTEKNCNKFIDDLVRQTGA